MSSPKLSEFSDYEVMFKKHVHDNLLLNSDLRLIDEMKKSKLKELKRDRDLFKTRFSRFNKHNALRPVPDGRYTGNATPRATHKPSFLVCKTSPCSFKTWENLTDITKEKVDVYKSDVLQSEEAVVSFRKKLGTDVSVERIAPARKISSALLPERHHGESALVRSQSTLTKSCDASDIKTEDKLDEAGDFHLPDFRQRSSTMPSYCHMTKRPFSDKVADTVSNSNLSYKESKYTGIECPKDSNTDDEKPDNKEDHFRQLHPSVINTDQCPDNIMKTTENEFKVTFNLPDNNIGNDSDVLQTASPKNDRRVQRAKSMVIQSNQLSPQMFRRRSYTFDTLNSMAGARKLLAKRESMNGFSMASRRRSLFDKLVNVSMASSADDSDTDWSKCYEDMQTCRYLRVPGQSIHGSREDLSLENITLGQER